jgi:L-alanine-DL-glutamate epimerase-like enolase superfamily enzyme
MAKWSHSTVSDLLPAPITDLSTIRLRIPFEDGGLGTGATPSRWHYLDTVLVRIEDADGHVGWGEAFAYFCESAVEAAVKDMISPRTVGRPIKDIAAWNLETQRALHLFGRQGITLYALSGVDIALWDLAAKRADVPLAQLLSPTASRKEVTTYASLVRYGSTELIERHCRHALDLGFRHIKLHEADPIVMRRAREIAGPDVELMVDANCAWSFDQAAALVPVFKETNLRWIEEPVFPPEDYVSHAKLESLGVAVGAGENASTAFEFERIAASLTFPQPSVTKIGGISVFLDAARSAAAHGRMPMPHSPYFGPGYFATLAMFAVLPPDSLLEDLFVEPAAWMAQTPRPVGGLTPMPKGPGLGFVPDLDVIERYRR